MNETKKIEVSWNIKLKEIKAQEHPGFYCVIRFKHFDDFKYMAASTDDKEITNHQGNFINNSLKCQFDLTDGTVNLFRINLN